MAASKCVKCDNGTFEIMTQQPAGSNVQLAFVQCSRCGGVAGVVQNEDTPTMVVEGFANQEKAIGSLSERLDYFSAQQQEILQMLKKGR